MTSTHCYTGSNNKTVWVHQLIKAGFALIPLMPGTKKTYDHNWQHTPPDSFKTILDYPDNYGVVLRDEFVVIDVDVKNFQAGDDPFLRLKTACGLGATDDFNTFTVRSKRGHDGRESLHVYFKKPKGMMLKTHDVTYGKGIEIKSVGAYLVGPGSIHPETGEPYVVTQGFPDALAPCPTHILQMYSRSPVPLRPGLEEPTDDEPTQQRFIDFLNAREPAIQGDGGDLWTVKTAMKGRDLNLSQEMTFNLMLQYWNERCSPPWGFKELAVKVANGYTYAKDSPGNDHPAAAFDVIDVPEESENVKKIRAIEKDRLHSETIAKIRWDADYDKNQQITKLHNTLINVKNYFLRPSYGEFYNPFWDLIRLNVYTGQIEFTRPAPWHKKSELVDLWEDDDTTDLRAFFSDVFRWNPSRENIFDGVLSIARDNAYHPVKDYFKTLKWDGVPRISKLYTWYAGAEENAYTHAVGRCTMIALVARVMEPGCKFDYVPILEGDQGIGKSTFCEILGGEWHSALTYLDPKNKDVIMTLAGTLIAEICEMAHTRREDVEQIKAFISRRTDPLRKPYGRILQHVKRSGIFIGTMNVGGDGAYLKDLTGNRRFWPIRTSVFHNDDLRRDRDQLFAEALYAWRSGEFYYLTDKEAARIAEAEQLSRTEQDPWVENVITWLEKERRQSRAYRGLTTQKISEEIFNLPAAQINRYAQLRIGNVMAQMGWRKGRVRDQGMMRQGYINPNYGADLVQLIDGV